MPLKSLSSGVPTRRPVRGATALRGGRVWRPTPYQAYGFLFFLVMTLAYWRVPPCCDTGLHAAVVERLKADLVHPRHPMADVPGAGSPYYSPYAVAQGAFARLTGLSGWDVLRLAGPFNLLVLLTGIGRFVRMLTPRPWAPVLALATLTLLWGTQPARWSGFLALSALTGTLGRPSVFALGLAFWAWALTGALARDGRRVRFVGPGGLPGLPGYVGLGALYGLIVLVDPVTAVTAALGGAAVVTGRQGNWRTAVVGRWALTVGAAVAVAAVWPYFDALTLPGDAAGTDGIHRRLYDGLPGRLWLALLGLPALWLRARRTPERWRDPLVLMCALGCLVVAYGWVGGRYMCVRTLVVALVGVQVALAVELAAPRPWPVRRRLLGTVAAAGATLGFLTVQAGAVVPRSLDPVGFEQPPRRPSYDWAVRYMGPGEVVITDGSDGPDGSHNSDAVHAIAGYGANLVAPVRADRALDERELLRRRADVRVYLAPESTRAERTAVVRRYHARWLLLTRRQPVPEEAVVVAWSRRTGEVLARVPRF